MKSLKVLLLAAVFCATGAYASAQLIKYITYYPVPSVTHSQIEVKKQTVLGAVDGGRIEIGSASLDAGGAVVGSTFEAKDVDIISYSSSEGKPNLIVGSKTTDVTTVAGNVKSHKNIDAEEWPTVAILEATGALKVHSIYWTGKGGFGRTKDGVDTWQDCPAIGSDGKATKLSWVQLKVVGSDEYKTYLVCGGLAQTAEPECNISCQAPYVVKGSPVRQNCRCVEDCSKRTDGRNVEVSGICCKSGQIVKESNLGKYCTFAFTQKNANVNAIVKTTCYPSGNSCNNATACNPDMSTLKYYYGGNVVIKGQEGETNRCGTDGKLCSSKNRKKNNKAYNKPHQEGWSGTLISECPSSVNGMDLCDAFCDLDNPSCKSLESSRYCYLKESKPSMPQGAKYRYSTCYTKDRSGCDHPVWTYGSKSDGYKCGDSYTKYAAVVYCSGK